jgi:hypothetical protein
MPANGDRSPLVETVVRLEEELRQYEALTAEIGRSAIISEKTLARAVKAVVEAAACRERLVGCVAALSEAMNDVRQRQEASLARMAEAAREVSQRAEAFQALLARYAALGEVAEALNVRASEIAARRAGGAASSDVYDAIGELVAGMGHAVVEAEAVSVAAKEADFEQIARDADALRQQMASARNRLSLAQRTLAEQASS